MSPFGRAPAALRRAVAGRERIVIRRPAAGDDTAIVRLAGLAERPALPHPVLIAEADGKLVAAVSTRTGEVVSDPFQASADVVELLRLRATQLDDAA
jgi:hypothetical protein